MADFDSLADLLLRASLQCSPAELQGCLSGQICAGTSQSSEIALALLAESYQIQLSGELAAELTEFYLGAQSSLAQGFDFQPLLPAADIELDARVSELAHWCQGFLDGFAQAFSRGGVTDANATAGEAAELREVLEDFAAIAQAGFEESNADEGSERDFVELVEYVRLAAINTYLELSTPESAAAESGPATAIGGPTGLFGGKLHR